MFMICFCTNLKGIHNVNVEIDAYILDVYDMLLY